MLKLMPVSALQPGMMVHKVVEQHGPVKIRKVGMIRSPEMIKGLVEMGVTELEIDLSQSVGIDLGSEAQDFHQRQVDTYDSNAQELASQPAITPTQQLLRNERQIAKASTAAEQLHHRSLFMPSSDSLPSAWQLYGKKVSLLSILLLGGLCVGWSLSHTGQWISAIQDSRYIASIPDAERAASNEEVLKKAQMLIDAQQQLLEEQSVNTAAADSKETQMSTPSREEQAEAAESIPAPIVLGYQEGSDIDLSDLADEQGRELTSNDLFSVQGSEESSLSGLSADLLNKVNQAAAEIDENSEFTASPETDLSRANNGEYISGNPARQSNNDSFQDLPRIDQLSIALQTKIPSMQFSAHLYSSNAENRWVRINGRRLMEGDYIAEGLQLVNIEPQSVVLAFEDEVFTMNALTNW
ncbi:general secretion pathway protein GspB [Glaciecola sp. MH2013]|uniref:general secretion pathway protein GspB n=1 Tax=Glaciecola sp. MH2013 TaxID=2785524 RepID=UPI00189F5D72|nr:general secretion pathway protein GspB [Glaciecola sp. MH2013]MBF7074833.1 general secretion pathway protein GspB [Glaciecola sp. MH2013]